MIIGFLTGMGGETFPRSCLPRASFSPKAPGARNGIQAGLGNFGVSIVQFVTPWIIGFAALGTIAGGPQLFTKVMFSRISRLPRPPVAWLRM